MRIYQSSITLDTLNLLQKHTPEASIHILRSYLVDGPGTFKLLSFKPQNIKSIALDSGTWSINQNTHKHHINAEIYGTFLSDCSKMFSFYFGFDPVHGDDGTEDSIENQLYLEKKKFNPIPVIQNLNIEVDYYCANSSKYPLVAIGATRKKKHKDLVIATKKLHKHGIKVHWFGVGSFAKILDAPVWSSDCSSFAQWLKSGRLIFYDQIKKKEAALATREYNKNGNLNKDYIRNHYLFDEYQSWLYETLGLSLEDVIFDHKMKLLVNSVYFYQLEQKVTAMQKSRGLIFDHE